MYILYVCNWSADKPTDDHNQPMNWVKCSGNCLNHHYTPQRTRNTIYQSIYHLPPRWPSPPKYHPPPHSKWYYSKQPKNGKTRQKSFTFSWAPKGSTDCDTSIKGHSKKVFWKWELSESWDYLHCIPKLKTWAFIVPDTIAFFANFALIFVG